MIKEAINKLGRSQCLSEEEAYLVNREIMSGEATDAQIGAFLMGLRLKGETVPEVVGMARAMKEFSLKIKTNDKVVDTCGTGGDGKKTFNISTLTAFVLAGAGLKVAKHGNRSVSSHCGSADLLEAAGVKIDLAPEKVESCLNQVGIAFLFAPLFHPAMKFAIGPRREMGIRTVFNLLGPLTNPAGASFQLVGVYSIEVMKLVAESLQKLGIEKATVVHSADGLDEVSVSQPTYLVRVTTDEITEEILEPERFGFPQRELSSIQTEGLDENLKILNSVLNGEKGPAREAVLLNAALALETTGKVSSVKEGLELAADSIDSGKAKAKLEKLIKFSQEAS